ncbi:MAG: hypothetical protein ACFE0J_03260 [Elainellaceae cyanobacterium]
MPSLALQVTGFSQYCLDLLSSSLKNKEMQQLRGDRPSAQLARMAIAFKS